MATRRSRRPTAADSYCVVDLPSLKQVLLPKAAAKRAAGAGAGATMAMPQVWCLAGPLHMQDAGGLVVRDEDSSYDAAARIRRTPCGAGVEAVFEYPGSVLPCADGTFLVEDGVGPSELVALTRGGVRTMFEERDPGQPLRMSACTTQMFDGAFVTYEAHSEIVDNVRQTIHRFYRIEAGGGPTARHLLDGGELGARIGDVIGIAAIPGDVVCAAGVPAQGVLVATRAQIWRVHLTHGALGARGTTEPQLRGWGLDPELWSVFAGSGETAHKDGLGAEASFEGISSIAVCADGGFVVKDGSRIRRISRHGRVASVTYAHAGTAGVPTHMGRDGPASLATFTSWGTGSISVDVNGMAVVGSCSGSPRVVNLATGDVASLACHDPTAPARGRDGGVFGGDWETSMALDAHGNILGANSALMSVLLVTNTGLAPSALHHWHASKWRQNAAGFRSLPPWGREAVLAVFLVAQRLRGKSKGAAAAAEAATAGQGQARPGGARTGAVLPDLAGELWCLVLSWLCPRHISDPDNAARDRSRARERAKEAGHSGYWSDDLTPGGFDTRSSERKIFWVPLEVDLDLLPQTLYMDGGPGGCVVTVKAAGWSQYGGDGDRSRDEWAVVEVSVALHTSSQWDPDRDGDDAVLCTTPEFVSFIARVLPPEVGDTAGLPNLESHRTGFACAASYIRGCAHRRGRHLVGDDGEPLGVWKDAGEEDCCLDLPAMDVPRDYTKHGNLVRMEFAITDAEPAGARGRRLLGPRHGDAFVDRLERLGPAHVHTSAVEGLSPPTAHYTWDVPAAAFATGVVARYQALSSPPFTDTHQRTWCLDYLPYKGGRLAQRSAETAAADPHFSLHLRLLAGCDALGHMFTTKREEQHEMACYSHDPDYAESCPYDPYEDYEDNLVGKGGGGDAGYGGEGQAGDGGYSDRATYTLHVAGVAPHTFTQVYEGSAMDPRLYEDGEEGFGLKRAVWIARRGGAKGAGAVRVRCCIERPLVSTVVVTRWRTPAAALRDAATKNTTVSSPCVITWTGAGMVLAKAKTCAHILIASQIVTLLRL